MLVNPFFGQIQNLIGIGFNTTASANYFINTTATEYASNQGAKGIAYMNVNSILGGAWSTSKPVFDISGGKYDTTGNIFFKGVMTDNAGGNYPAYFTNSSVCDANVSALYLSANNGGGAGAEYAAYAARGDFKAATGYGLQGLVKPPTYADAAAPNNSVYFSSTANKLVYKDAGGVVNNLY